MSEVVSSPNQPPTITQQQLFEFFPFLENTQNYPQASVQAYLSIAGNFVDQNIWGSVWSYGVALVTAHLLTIIRLTNEDIAKGGSGNVVGVVTSVSAIGVSKGINVDMGAVEDGGFWNTTQFGREYLSLAKLFGMGCAQLGTEFTAQFMGIPIYFSGQWFIPLW